MITLLIFLLFIFMILLKKGKCWIRVLMTIGLFVILIVEAGTFYYVSSRKTNTNNLMYLKICNEEEIQQRKDRHYSPILNFDELQYILKLSMMIIVHNSKIREWNKHKAIRYLFYFPFLPGYKDLYIMEENLYTELIS